MIELKLMEYIRLCTEFEKDGDPKRQEELERWISEVVIKEYMPLKDKIIHLMEIITTVPSESDAPGAAGSIENGKVIFGLLNYCVNLENDAGVIARTFSVYDMIMEHGLGTKILNICREDYRTFCGMVSDMINVTNMEKFVETAALQNVTEYDKWVETMKELKTSLTPEMIRDLLIISERSDGALRDFEKDLAGEALRQANVAIANDEHLATAIREAAAARAEAEKIEEEGVENILPEEVDK